MSDVLQGREAQGRGQEKPEGEAASASVDHDCVYRRAWERLYKDGPSPLKFDVLEEGRRKLMDAILAEEARP